MILAARRKKKKKKTTKYVNEPFPMYPTRYTWALFVKLFQFCAARFQLYFAEWKLKIKILYTDSYFIFLPTNIRTVYECCYNFSILQSCNTLNLEILKHERKYKQKDSISHVSWLTFLDVKEELFSNRNSTNPMRDGNASLSLSKNNTSLLLLLPCLFPLKWGSTFFVDLWERLVQILLKG